LVVLSGRFGQQASDHSFKVWTRMIPDFRNSMFGIDGLSSGLRAGEVLAGCAQVAEWLMAADCKSATHRVTEVRILPCAPLSFSVVVVEELQDW
jgi:hypothetical protein